MPISQASHFFLRKLFQKTKFIVSENSQGSSALEPRKNKTIFPFQKPELIIVKKFKKKMFRVRKLNDGLIHGDMPTVGEPDVTTTVNVQEIKCLEMVMARPKKVVHSKNPYKPKREKVSLDVKLKEGMLDGNNTFPDPSPIAIALPFPIHRIKISAC
jgi:hypothetical protein